MSRTDEKQKKKMNEKKKSVFREAGLATAHFPALGHDTIYCIVTGKGTGAQGCAAGGHDTASSPATQPHDTASKGPRHPRPARGASGSARSHGLATTVCRDTKFGIVTGGGDIALRHGSSACDTALRYNPARARHSAQRTWHGLWVTIQFLYCDRGRPIGS